MKKHSTVLLAFALILVLALPAQAATYAIHVSCDLSFSGTTANCRASIHDEGCFISATMELWEGATCVASWSDSDVSRVTFSETAAVSSGHTYVLMVSGTANGIPFSASSTLGTC